MADIWEHGSVSVDKESSRLTWHLYSTFPDTLEWSNKHDSVDSFAEFVDLLGRAGWQMVGVVEWNDAIDHYFKRLRPE